MAPAKAISFNVIIFLGMILVTSVLLEIALRAYFSVTNSPEIFLYGTPYCCGLESQSVFDTNAKKALAHQTTFTARFLDNSRKGYSKFKPNEEKTDYVKSTNEKIIIRINKFGFRGKITK